MRPWWILPLMTSSVWAGAPPECAKLPPMAHAAAVSAGIQMGLQILRTAPSGESSVLSSFVLEELLYTLADGSRGRTRQEFTKILPENVSPLALHCLAQDWQISPPPQEQAQPEETPPPQDSLTVEFAGQAWVAPAFPVKESFQKLLENDLGWGVSTLPSSTTLALAQVNQWLAAQTHGVIDALFPPNTIKEQTQLVLACTAFFKGSWAHPFPKTATHLDTFTTNEGQKLQTPTMLQTAFLEVADRHHETIVLLPIAGAQQRWALLLAIPKTELASTVLSRLSPAEWSQWLAGARSVYVELHLPRFRVASSWDLMGTLQQLGVTQAFTPSADFSNISEIPSLHIGALLHQAVLEVNEEGLLAAAAAGAAMNTLAIREPPVPMVIRVNRPFLCGVVDRVSGGLLFLALVNQPEGP